MKLTHVYKCGDCPLYLPHCPAGKSNGRPVAEMPQQCTHPDMSTGMIDLTLGGPNVLPHKCPMLKNAILYRAALTRKPL